MIKNIIFDFGGVIITLDHAKAVESFKQLGIADAEKRLDPYTQGGIFGDLEIGSITADEFLSKLCDIAGHDIGYDECRQAWLSYHSELPKRNLDILRQLRKEGYRLILLSNTNPFMMSWAESDEFDGEGNPLSSYFDAEYKSFEVKFMKPDPSFFMHVLSKENILPSETLFVDDGPRNVATASQLCIHTFCPANGSDWTKEIYQHLKDDE